MTDSFTQNAITSAQSTDAERSVVVSRFEDAEHQQATRRTLRNDNECYAVTYFVRGVSEAYEASTRVLSIEWRIGETPWRDISDQDDLAPEIREALKPIVEGLPKPGESLRDERRGRRGARARHVADRRPAGSGVVGHRPHPGCPPCVDTPQGG